KILCAGLIDISRDQTLAADDDIKEAIRIGYDEAKALANYLEINNCTSNSIQQQISYNETSLDNNTNASEIIDNEDDQDQNLGTAAFEVFCLLLDESDNYKEITEENKMTNSIF
ncbi:8120_t:CDS:2, partial [Rhizophagus irregularis]